MHLQIFPLLLLSMAASLSRCGAQPRLLTRCPADFETVVEPLPAAVGDPVLLVGAGVRLRTVDFVQDSTLRAEADRLVLNQSVETSAAANVGPYSRPHVVLCTDASQPLVTFSLFFRLVPKTAAAATNQKLDTIKQSPTSVGHVSVQQPADATAPMNMVLISVLAILGLICTALGLALGVVIQRMRGYAATRHRAVDRQPIYKPNCKDNWNITENPTCHLV